MNQVMRWLWLTTILAAGCTLENQTEALRMPAAACQVTVNGATTVADCRGMVDARATTDGAVHPDGVSPGDVAPAPDTLMSGLEAAVMDDSATPADRGAMSDGGVSDGGGTSDGDGSSSDACVPTTCAARGANCGQIPDGCGGMLQCGNCKPPLTCGGGELPNVCGCTPRTCQQKGARCGQIPDGCGGMLNCGNCKAGQVCVNVNGKPNQCCTPTTCARKGVNCGQIPDGCGGILNCGVCAGGQCCGGGGRPNVCGACPCVPTTCAAQGKNCGLLPDGCGNLLSCGSCNAPTCCGGGGTPNVCGVAFSCNGVCGATSDSCGNPVLCQGCVPTTCAQQNANCGTLSDGCGGTLDCGGCTAPQSCGGSGHPNLCGSSCTPTTCAASQAECGYIPDGCGGIRDCGGCTFPKTCGYGNKCVSSRKLWIAWESPLACKPVVTSFVHCLLERSTMDSLALGYPTGYAVGLGGTATVPASCGLEWQCIVDSAGFPVAPLDVVMVIKTGSNSGYNGSASVVSGGVTVPIHYAYVPDQCGDCSFQTWLTSHELFEATTDGVSADCCNGQVAAPPFSGASGCLVSCPHCTSACAQYGPSSCGGNDTFGRTTLTCYGQRFNCQKLSSAPHEFDGTCVSLTAH